MAKLLTPGGSGKGLSHWLGYLVCPRRQEYRGVHKAKHPAPGVDKPVDSFVGTLGHAYLEELYQGRWHKDLGPLAFTTMSEQGFETPLVGYGLETAEAWRVIQVYPWPRDEFIAPVTEVLIRDDSYSLCVPELTGRCDLVAQHRGGVLAGSGVFIPAGYYIIDHKFEKQSASDLGEKHRIQLQVYCDIWNRWSERPFDVAGGIVNQIVRTKLPKFERAFVPLAREGELGHVAETLAYCHRLSINEAGTRNVTKCQNTGYYQPCEFRDQCLK
jgi:hypothetical protein